MMRMLNYFFPAPNPQSKSDDYKKPDDAIDPYFCSRGHLAPSGAFNTEKEARLTFIMTNVAPQWQAFNRGNWAAVEKAVKNYTSVTGHDVYVFTGTGKVTTLLVNLRSQVYLPITNTCKFTFLDNLSKRRYTLIQAVLLQVTSYFKVFHLLLMDVELKHLIRFLFKVTALTKQKLTQVYCFLCSM